MADEAELEAFRRQWQQELHRQREVESTSGRPSQQQKRNTVTSSQDTVHDHSAPARDVTGADALLEDADILVATGGQAVAGADDTGHGAAVPSHTVPASSHDVQAYAEPTSHDHSQDTMLEQSGAQATPANDATEEALRLHFEAMKLEEEGELSEAVTLYRKATRLVPDIEFKALRIVRDELSTGGKQRRHADAHALNTASEEESGDDIVGQDLVEHFSALEPHVKRRSEKEGGHIGDLPPEMIHHILCFAVAPDLDLQPVERMASTCRALFLVCRHETLWRQLAHILWPDMLEHMPWPSWREATITRPRALFHGLYVSKIIYTRHGEQGMDDNYRPCHLVQYYRYLRFLPGGKVMTATSSEVPEEVAGRLRNFPNTPETLNALEKQGVMCGAFEYEGNTVRVAFRKHHQRRQRPVQRRGRRRAEIEVEETGPVATSFVLSLAVQTRKAIPSHKLAWNSYHITQHYEHRAPVRTEVDMGDQLKPFFFFRKPSYK